MLNLSHKPSLVNVRSASAGLVAGISAIAMLAASTPAHAGGFSIREQSASSQGASFAGNAANTDLSAMYWNPAAAANKSGPGINSESHFSVIFPRADVTVERINGFPVALAAPGVAASSGIAGPAIVPASYASMQISERAFVGISVNSGFGLTTKPDNLNYAGSVLGRTSKLFTTNVTPTLAYKVAPGVTIGVGIQMQFADGKFAFANPTPTSPATTSFRGNDFAFGATAGIMLTPAEGTRIGLGWRSALTHNLGGDFETNANGALVGASRSANVELNLPDIVTLSFNQALAPNMRLLGTVEWSHWSRFKQLQVDLPGVPSLFDPTIAANWRDGWFFSLGGEYDYSRDLTLRTGVAYEISPVDAPEKRILGIPDSNRIWLSFGGTYKVTEVSSIDLAYSHVFLENGAFSRSPIGSATVISGNVEAATDIVSMSYKTKW